jgi:hypothetical protein
VEGHRLRGERVEAQRGQLVVHADLQLGDGVVLQLGADLPHEVAHDEGDHEPAELRPHAVGADAALAHLVHDDAHDVGGGVGQEEHVAQRGEHRPPERPDVAAGRLPEVVEGPPHDGSVAGTRCQGGASPDGACTGEWRHGRQQ